MHIVIMGCGRVGSAIAHQLDQRGHSVAIIDRNPIAFRRLAPDFGGRPVKGVGFDRKTLAAAGIEDADAFAAVSSGDNSNIIAARVARETFSVSNVVARIYDPKRAAVYERLGIPTVATVPWTTDRLLHALLPEGHVEMWRDPSGIVSLQELKLDEGWLGEPIDKLEAATGARIAFVTRFGNAVLPTESSVIQQGDLVHVLVTDEIARVAFDVAAAAPEEGR